MEPATRGHSSLPIDCLQSCPVQMVAAGHREWLCTSNMASPNGGLSLKYTQDSEDFIREKECHMPH